MIETTETEYRNADLPSDVTKAHLQLKEHDANRVKVQKLIEFSHEEGEQIVVRVRQQVSPAMLRSRFIALGSTTIHIQKMFYVYFISFHFIKMAVKQLHLHFALEY